MEIAVFPATTYSVWHELIKQIKRGYAPTLLQSYSQEFPWEELAKERHHLKSYM